MFDWWELLKPKKWLPIWLVMSSNIFWFLISPDIRTCVLCRNEMWHPRDLCYGILCMLELNYISEQIFSYSTKEERTKKTLVGRDLFFRLKPWDDPGGSLSSYLLYILHWDFRDPKLWQSGFGFRGPIWDLLWVAPTSCPSCLDGHYLLLQIPHTW